jgi:spermidine synthase
MTETPIDIRINNIHQAYNLPVDRRIHEQWAKTSLTIIGRAAKVLLMGYASGVTADAYLSSPLLKRLDIVENCDPVVEAGRRFFPKEYARVVADPRARMIVDDFRGFARFTKERYDVIALDHSLEDPYQIGFLTTEFFDQLKAILEDGGVVLLLGDGLSWNTTRMSFRHIYKNVAPDIEPHIQHHCLYMTDEPFRPEVAVDYQRLTNRVDPGGLVYSDHRVWRTPGLVEEVTRAHGR